MSKALYTKYRPRVFTEVVGQSTAVEILRNSIKLNKINHAYLFYGIRGTGKTTLARIFAKAINCKDLTDNNPCNQCDSCKEINSSSMIDVIEIDAATHNGVDEIRDLTEKANYATSGSKYKVYIIDEIHMLTKQAFNALLKTLEEPPKNTIFLLATTEINKIPDTILSRSLVLNLSLVEESEITQQLANILDAEGLMYDKQALEYMAELSEGSVRDGISILETCLLFSRTVNMENTVQALSLISKEDINNILNTPNRAINIIKPSINGKKLMILLVNELIHRITKGDAIYKTLLNTLTNGMISIKDPFLLNKYIVSTLINANSNVSRETIDNTPEQLPVKEEKTQPKAHKIVDEPIIQEKTEEPTSLHENKEEVQEQLEETVPEKVEEPINETVSSEESSVSRETLKFEEIYTPRDYIYFMLNANELNLQEINAKWPLFVDYADKLNDGNIKRLLSKAKPLVASSEAVIIGVENKELLKAFREIALSKELLHISNDLFNKKILFMPIDSDNWSILIKAAKQAKDENVSIPEPKSIGEIITIDDDQSVSELFGDKLVKNEQT